MIGTIRRLSAFAGLALSGTVAAQAPAFAQQYLQRLGGHVDEARLAVAAVAEAAAADPDAFRSALALLQDRAASLEAAYSALAGADMLTRPVVLLRHLDAGIAAAAWRDFEPALPLTPGALIYGLVCAGLLMAVGMLAKRWHRGRARSLMSVEAK